MAVMPLAVLGGSNWRSRYAQALTPTSQGQTTDPAALEICPGTEDFSGCPCQRRQIQVD